MRKNKHPKLYPCEIELADGSKTTLYLTSQISSLKTNLDYTNHPAWNKGKQDVTDVFVEISKFKKKFQDLDL